MEKFIIDTSDPDRNFVQFSPIPDVCKENPCVLGIDEAGRGPALGPMVYGIAFCPKKKEQDLKDLGVDDSKALTEAQREALLVKLQENEDYIGYAIHSLSPHYISNCMYRRAKYNLNTISHDTAIGLIQQALDRGVRVSEVYVDTVGLPEKYQAKLEAIFPELKITVAKKADSLYPCVSAASICAKVVRDHILKNWNFKEKDVKPIANSLKWGSGYPGDPVTKKFLQEQFHPLFGFPSIVRFSWKTAEKILNKKGLGAEFEEVEPEEDEKLKKNPSMKDFFVQIPNQKDKLKLKNRSHPYFKDRNLSIITEF